MGIGTLTHFVAYFIVGVLCGFQAQHQHGWALLWEYGLVVDYIGIWRNRIWVIKCQHFNNITRNIDTTLFIISANKAPQLWSGLYCRGKKTAFILLLSIWSARAAVSTVSLSLGATYFSWKMRICLRCSVRNLRWLNGNVNNCVRRIS